MVTPIHSKYIVVNKYNDVKGEADSKSEAEQIAADIIRSQGGQLCVYKFVDHYQTAVMRGY